MRIWRKYNGALIPTGPPHLEVDDSNIKLIVKRTDSYFARWTTNFDCGRRTEFWHVICDEFLPIESLSRNTRSKIRRGLKKCSIKLVNRNIILDQGFECYKAAVLNYNTTIDLKTESEFRIDISELEGSWDFWAIFYENRIIGYSQNRLIDDYCDYSTIKLHPKYLSFYSSYVLFFTMNKYYLHQLKFRYVNDGARNILHNTNIQDFLITKFGFRRAYCKLHLKYSTTFKLLVTFIYPFRFVFYSFNNRFATKIKSLFLQEKIRRSFL
tara:strand:+ start:272 stop:1075 length:804 start_codon:yes stop_codon:yes gene_type:complete